MQVGTGYHLDQRHAAAFEVDDGAVDLVMQQLARVLLEVDALETAGVLYAVHIEEYLAVLANRHIKLRDLICLGQVGVKIVLAVRLAELVDRAAGRLAHSWRHSVLPCLLRTGSAPAYGADRAGMGVDRCAEARGARAVNLALGGQLRVHFQTDDSFVFHVCLPPLQCRDDVLEAGSLLEGQTCVEQGLLAEARADELACRPAYDSRQSRTAEPGPADRRC